MSRRISKALNFQCYENSFDKAQLAKYFKFNRINFRLNMARSVSTNKHTIDLMHMT